MYLADLINIYCLNQIKSAKVLKSEWEWGLYYYYFDGECNFQFSNIVILICVPVHFSGTVLDSYTIIVDLCHHYYLGYCS